jgi:hypothetical protein
MIISSNQQPELWRTIADERAKSAEKGLVVMHSTSEVDSACATRLVMVSAGLGVACVCGMGFLAPAATVERPGTPHAPHMEVHRPRLTRACAHTLDPAPQRYLEQSAIPASFYPVNDFSDLRDVITRTLQGSTVSWLPSRVLLVVSLRPQQQRAWLAAQASRQTADGALSPCSLLPASHESQQEERTVLMINCGATMYVKDLLVDLEVSAWKLPHPPLPSSCPHAAEPTVHTPFPTLHPLSSPSPAPLSLPRTPLPPPHPKKRPSSTSKTSGS